MHLGKGKHDEYSRKISEVFVGESTHNIFDLLPLFVPFFLGSCSFLTPSSCQKHESFPLSASLSLHVRWFWPVAVEGVGGGEGRKEPEPRGMKKERRRNGKKRTESNFFFAASTFESLSFALPKKKVWHFSRFPPSFSPGGRRDKKKFSSPRLCPPPPLRPAKQTDGRLFSLLFLCRGFGKQGYQCQGKLSQKSHQKTTLLNLSGENDLHFLAPLCQQNLLFDSSLQLRRPQAMPRVRHLRLSRGGPRRRLRREYTHTYTERRIRDDNYNPYCEGTSAEGASAVFRGGQWRSLSIRPRRILLRPVPKGEEAYRRAAGRTNLIYLRFPLLSRESNGCLPPPTLVQWCIIHLFLNEAPWHK